MRRILVGANGSSFELSFLNGVVDAVIDDQWNEMSIQQKLFYEMYWRIILKKPLKKVCFDFSYINKLDPSKDIIYLGNIFKREYLLPILKRHGYILDDNLFEAFDLSPKLCEIRRKSVTKEEIRKKDYEDDSLKLKIMANMVPKGIKSICDVGCGERKLMRYISGNVRYYGIDYIRTADNIINIDLNKESMPHMEAECIFGCGILEFIDDISRFLNECVNLNPRYMIFSYSPREYSKISTQRSRVYHNCLYSNQIISDVCSHGYILKDFIRYESRQVIYFFNKIQEV